MILKVRQRLRTSGSRKVERGVGRYFLSLALNAGPGRNRSQVID